MKSLLYILLLISFNILGQCPSGTLGVTGAGCGCIANCNLTALGGPNCGATGIAGDCNGGYLTMSTDIVVPNGCNYVVTATMRPRGASCSASGADGNCNTCDRLKVDIVGGVKSFQIGASNATLNDSYTLTGPGTIRISGAANRADEIITYTTSSTLCPTCSGPLPIELIEFEGEKQEDAIKISWSTLSQTNNDYFSIERLTKGIWEPISYINSDNGNQFHKYEIFDYFPPKEVIYYRLKQVDFDGVFTYSKIISIDNSIDLEIPKRINILNQTVDENYKGMVILIYENKIEKTWK